MISYWITYVVVVCSRAWHGCSSPELALCQIRHQLHRRHRRQSESCSLARADHHPDSSRSNSRSRNYVSPALPDTPYRSTNSYLLRFMPQSPRWLMDQGRDAESLAVIAGLRRQAPESELVQLEYLELKAQKLFEDRMSRHYFPEIQDDSAASRFRLGLAQYKSLFSNASNRKRTSVAILVMLFQQWTGVNFILYCSLFPSAFPGSPELEVLDYRSAS